LTDIYTVDTQYYSSTYYVSSFNLQYSLDGNDFYYYTDYTGAIEVRLLVTHQCIPVGWT